MRVFDAHLLPSLRLKVIFVRGDTGADSVARTSPSVCAFECTRLERPFAEQRITCAEPDRGAPGSSALVLRAETRV